MSPVRTPARLSVATLVADLEELEASGKVDPLVVSMVREALLAIADEVQHRRPLMPGDLVEILALIDPRPS